MENTALIIIDVQKAIDGFSGLERNNPSAEGKIAQLLAHWRAHSLPVFHIRHSSKFASSPYHESSTAYEFKAEVAPRENEVVITKHENCAFIDTDLEQMLKQQNIQQLVICGVLTNNSVDATVRVAAGLVFSVIVPTDATAAFAMDCLNGKHFTANDVHWLFLSNLNSEYCKVLDTHQLLGHV